MPTNGKQKGSRAERQVVALILPWWRQIEPTVDGQPLTFARTPGSGSWGHGGNRASFGTSADLVTNSKLFPWACEVKHRERWSPDNFLKGGKSPVWTWYAQCVSQAAEVNKIPMLWFRKNQMEWWVMIPLKPGDAVGGSVVDFPERGVIVWEASDVLSWDPKKFSSQLAKTGHTSGTKKTSKASRREKK
jgi:hypothetical protein